MEKRKTCVLITPKETECLMWGLAQIGDYPTREAKEKTDPLFILDRTYKRDEIVATCQMFFRNFETGRHVFYPLTELERDILRCCLENTSWLTSYDVARHSEAMKSEARGAMRDLAFKLEPFGVEVSYLPAD
jgi:hypothetical protein